MKQLNSMNWRAMYGRQSLVAGTLHRERSRHQQVAWRERWPWMRMLLVLSLLGVMTVACLGQGPFDALIDDSYRLTVVTETTGRDAPTNYMLKIQFFGEDDSHSDLIEELTTEIASSSTVTFDVGPGHYIIFLKNVPPNCSESGDPWAEIDEDQRRKWEVTCHANRIQVTTSTSGSDLDPDGYQVTVDGIAGSIWVNDSERQTIDINGTGTLRHLKAFPSHYDPQQVYDVGLAGLASGCQVSDDDNPRQVQTAQDQTVEISFEVTCGGTGGAVVLEDRFDDGSPVDGRWNKVTAYQAGGVIDSVRHESTDGNPDGYRYMVHAFPDSGQISVYHFYTGGVYVPGEQGAISHIIYQEDRRQIDKPTPGAAIGTLFIAEQGGTVYYALVSPGNAFSNEVWERLVTPALAASDFSPAGLDFSAAGDTITFGFLRSNTHHGHSPLTLKHGIDNWRVEVHRQ